MLPLIKHYDLPANQSVDLHQLHRQSPERYPHLLETVALGSTGNQYDVLFAFPRETLALERFDVDYQLTIDGVSSDVEDADFLSAFNERWQQQGVKHTSDDNSDSLPFKGGWFVYLGYELAQQIEPTLQLPKSHDGLPVAFATRIPAALIKDHNNNRIIVFAEQECAEAFEILCEDVESVLSQDTSSDKPQNNIVIVKNIMEDDPKLYLAALEKIKHYIRDGDVFQVNISRQWQTQLPDSVTHNDLYQALRHNNPAPFFGLATYKDNAIISSSPERLVRVTNNQIETRPIAGTRPRSDKDNIDKSNQTELIGHPKERAEHIMLIDLERNDLGRVCVPGSVHVNELMVIESFAHVHHIVSNVRGELRKDTLPGNVIRAVFPGGTITGCPKVRCMEIIAELEHTGRGAYTGSMGYINHDASMDFNILIRTMVKHENQLFIRAGAGIVSDSIAEKELNETRAKARGLLLALNIDTI